MTLMWQVVRWELGRHLRNKQYLLGLFLTPLIFTLFAGVPTLLQRLDRPKEQLYFVVDELGILPELQDQLAGSGVRLEAFAGDEDTLRNMILERKAEGYFVLDDSFVEHAYLTVHVETMKPRPSALTAALATTLQTWRMREQQIDESLLDYVNVRPTLVTSVISESPESSGGNLPMAIGFSFLLFMLIMTSGAMLLQSALQEKRDRMSEVILSSIGPDTLMGGKIIAHFLLGIFQICVWLSIALPVAVFLLKLPVGNYITPSLIPLYALLTLLGYLLYAALFVGIGATMEDLQSASNSQGMVFMLPMLSFFVIGPVISNPDGTIARVATFFPLTSPTITLLRTGFTALAAWEIAVVSVVLLLTTVLVVKAAAKLFRTGMLMYGKNASLREIWRWLRYP